ALRRGLPFARVLAAGERHNAFFDDPIQYRGGWDSYRDTLYESAGLAPADIDVLQCYDDYPVVVMMQLEDLGFCAKGQAPALVRERALTFDGGDLPLNTSGGQLSAGQAGAAGGFINVAEALRQLTGAAGSRQVENARTALVSGYGMVNYDRCLCTAAAILEQGT
ncbi:MAG: thiolase family protein, partial [Gammaproteobacteria bacterium]|nr:thiolase family protein [Gammaproteobacteria bacterium]